MGSGSGNWIPEPPRPDPVDNFFGIGVTLMVYVLTVLVGVKDLNFYFAIMVVCSALATWVTLQQLGR